MPQSLTITPPADFFMLQSRDDLAELNNLQQCWGLARENCRFIEWLQALAMAEFYQGIVDSMVIDTAHQQLQRAIVALGMGCPVTNTTMRDKAYKRRLAGEVLVTSAEVGHE